jgi:hypothetical protein
MSSREHGGARGIAERILAIGAIEPHALRCKLVDVWRLGELAAVTAEFRAKIVGDDEQQVEFVRLGGKSSPQQSQTQTAKNQDSMEDWNHGGSIPTEAGLVNPPVLARE